MSGARQKAAKVAAEALLDAGAVLPEGSGAAKDTVDTLTTRAYRHPVLGDRTVVRLVPGTLGPAEDLTMEFLGFTAPETVAEVGVVRQQALGFPAWALVHDPANGHHALALVKEVERLVRIAKSRIGPARDGFVALGEQLSRAVPHFLPTFYEEAARAFLAADSPTYAASMFGKARDAERAFALKIDEEHQHTVFLEFALAGALTAKALSAHSRDLAARSDALTAYDRFRRLCLERTLGGMPPYASMHTDLRRLAKAAKLGEAEEESLLRDLLAAPSIVRAPGGFWTAYRPVLVRVAKKDPKVRGQLLAMFPSECPDDVWLGILEDSGATAALTEPAGSVPAEAEPADGPAGWLVRMDKHRSGWRRKRLPALQALAERMAPRLRADGLPLDLCRANGYVDLDLDLVDLCMELGLPMSEVSSVVSCRVDQWFSDDTEGRRDLVEVVKDEHLLHRIAGSIEHYLKKGWGNATVSPEKVVEVIGVPGLRTALHWWMDRLADQVVGQGLPSLDEQLERLTLVACPEGLAVNPDAVRRITEHDLGPILAGTLRAGVFDEFGWPALEAAVDRLVDPGLGDVDEDDWDAEVATVQQWPQLILRTGDHVTVVGADEVELEHMLRIPADQRRRRWSIVLRYVDGQLLVSWSGDEDRFGYWSGTADDVFTTPGDAWPNNSSTSLALAGGGRTAGGRPLHVGDRSAEERWAVSHDGRHYWTLVRSETDHQWRWHEFDAATGVLGRQSMPAFFEADAVDGESLVQFESTLLPAPPQAATSPLGQRDGLIGWRVRTTADGARVGTGIDGRTFTLTGATRHSRGRRDHMQGAVRFPGAEQVYGVVLAESWRDNRVVLCAQDGSEVAAIRTGLKRDPFREGTRLLPPVRYWHFLQVRDEAGSRALRAVTDGQAGQLLAAVIDLIGPEQKIDAGTARKLVGETIPELTHPALVSGVAGVAKQAARSAARLAALTTATAAIAAEPVADPDAHLPEDQFLNAALSALIPSCYNRGHNAANLFLQVGAALLGREPQRPVAVVAAHADPDWFDAIHTLPAILWRAVAPATSAKHREHVLGLLDVIAGTGLLTATGRVRRLGLLADDLTAVPDVGQILEQGDRRLVVLRSDKSDGEVKAVEFDPEGRFGPVPGHTIRHAHVLDHGGWVGERLAAFVAVARERGQVPWRPEWASALSTAAGMSVADATVLLADPRHIIDRKKLKEETGQEPDAWQADPSVTDAALEGALADRGELSRNDLRDIGAALLPADPEALWTSGPSIEGVAAWHVARHGVRLPVSDDLLVDVRKAGLTGRSGASQLLHGVANPDTFGALRGTPGGISFDSLLETAVRMIPWLVRRLPAGDPVRLALPRVLELIRQRLADPALEIRIGSVYEDNVPKLIESLGLPVTTDGAVHDAGIYKVNQSGRWPSVSFRPALMEGPDDPRVAALVAQFHGGGRVVTAMRAVMAGQLDSWAAAAASPDGGDADHDPSRSAPGLVAEVAARHGLDADVATLYLQLLALPDPTDRNVAAWTGWKPARLKKARAELAATDLVVEAKRPRAGRTLFLPGGWLPLGTPHLPLERWKLPLTIGDGDNVTSLGAVIPVAPAPHLFTVAWARIIDGDHPRFEELTTRGRR